MEHATPAAAAAFLATSPAALIMAAMERGATVAEAQAMAKDQSAWLTDQARLAFHTAFLAFKGETVRIVKNMQGSGEWMYADLPTVLAAVTGPLAKHGLTVSCKTTRDDPEWIEVTAEMRHSGGHVERFPMGAPPGEGGDLPAQDRAATTTILQRQSVKAACGVAEEGEDFATAGLTKKTMLREGWVAKAAQAANDPELKRILKEGEAAFRAARDSAGYADLAKAAQARREVFKAEPRAKRA